MDGDEYGAELVDYSKTNVTPEQTDAKNKGKKESPAKESKKDTAQDNEDYGIEL